ncbi:unnamed protein product [Cercospora beticola]|nr:unnamed protein product [Cercospora beticola]
MCGLRAYEIVRKLGYSGPFQPKEVEGWFKEVDCLDGHVPSPEVDIVYEVRDLSYDGIEGIAIVLPPGYKCPRHSCDSYHSVFKVKFILQVWLRRFTASDWTQYTNKPDLEYSHLDSQTRCMNPVHAIYERGVVNVARQRCTTTGTCHGHGRQPACLLEYATDVDFDAQCHEMTKAYAKDILVPSACPEEGCTAVHIWPEMWHHFKDAHFPPPPPSLLVDGSFHMSCPNEDCTFHWHTNFMGVIRKKKYDHATEVLLMWSEVMVHITLYFFFEEEIGECGAGGHSKLLTRERKNHNFLEVPMNFRPMTLDCNTLFPHTDGAYQYREQILLEREVITDVGSMFNTMHFTDLKTSCNFTGQVKKLFNKAIVKRSEAMMESRSAVSEAEEETFMWQSRSCRESGTGLSRK